MKKKNFTNLFTKCIDKNVRTCARWILNIFIKKVPYSFTLTLDLLKIFPGAAAENISMGTKD